MRLVWAARARRQLLEIVDYIAQDAPERALAFGQRIESEVRKLERFPNIGRVVPELIDEVPALRELLIGDYRLVYRIRPRRVEVVTVFHGHRRLEQPR